MRVLASQTGVEAPSATYPKGRVVNDLTLISEEVNGDIIQFFQKLIQLVSITENDLADNETNGYQLVDALNEYMLLRTESWTSATLLNSWVDVASADYSPVRYRKYAQRMIHIEGSCISGTDIHVFTLPVGYRPTYKTLFTFSSLDATEAQRQGVVFENGEVYLNTSTVPTASIAFNFLIPLD